MGQDETREMRGQRHLLTEYLLPRLAQGWNLVPLLGTGVSVDAGIPTLAELTRYLAKTQTYIARRVFQYLPAEVDRDLEEKEAGQRRRRTLVSPGVSPHDQPSWRFLREFGWPNPNDLTFELWHWLARTDSLSEPRDYRRRMDQLVEERILEDLEYRDQKFIAQARRLHSIYFGAAEAWRLGGGGHWTSLLNRLTRTDPDLSDALFHRLTRQRRPGLTQRYLAFLTPVLGLRLFLTTNFDSLLEDALLGEGLNTTVYGVADGSPLPAPSLLRGGRAVLKLHGDSHGLLVGERLNQPLDLDTRGRLREALPERPLVLVLGMGGWDARILDLVELAVSQRDGCVVWLHFEPSLPQPVEKLRECLAVDGISPERFRSCRTRSPALFLQELLERRTTSHPSIRRPYRALDPRPIPESVQSSGTVALKVPELGSPAAPSVRVFVDHPDELGLAASLRLAEFVAECSGTHLPVWIDLESKHTIDDVVADLISQVRRYDPDLPPEIIPTELALPSRRRARGQRPEYEKAVRRIYSALSRGRYVVAFHGVGSFGRPATQHHGLAQHVTTAAQEADEGLELLYQLAKMADQGASGQPLGALYLKDSILAFSIGSRRRRREGTGELPPLLGKLQSLTGTGRGIYCENVATEPELAGFAGRRKRWIKDHRDALLLLCAFRARRSHVALAELLPKYIRQRETNQPLDEFLGTLEADRWIVHLEGGSWWMGRGLRNQMYEQLSEHLDSSELLQVLHDGRDDRASDRFERFIRLIAVHHDLSIYFMELFNASSDPQVLLEGLYHRISTLRYLTKFEVWAAVVPKIGGEVVERMKCLLEPPQRAAGSAKLSLLTGYELDSTEIAGLRLGLLRTLRSLLRRESERLRTALPNQSFLSWLDWVRREDIPRLSCQTCLKGSDPDRSSCEDSQEFKREIEDLRVVLDDLEIKVQADRMNLQGVMDAGKRLLGERLQGIGPDSRDGFRDESVDTTPEALAKVQLADPGAVKGEAELRAVKWEADHHRALFQMARALRRADHASSEHFGRLLFEAIPEQPEKPCDRPRAEALYQRQIADHELRCASPFDAKGQTLVEFQRLRRQAEKADDACGTALRLLAAVPEDRSAAVSYLRSLSGRALAFQGQFQEAYRAFDQSRCGLRLLPAERREPLAASLLRLAECLILRADAGLVGEPDDWREPDEAWLSEIGRRRLLVWQQNGGEADRVKLGGSRPTSVVRDLLCQSMSNWGHDTLQSPEFFGVEEGRVGEEVGNRLAAARSRLSRADEVLDGAQRVLERTRRSVEWWACLFQLRAQLEVERLLLMAAGDAGFRQSRDATELDDGPNWNRSPSHFINRFMASLRRGLQATRRGLDVLLPEIRERDPEDLSRDRRVTRMLRLWVELMICGADLTQRSTERDLEGADLWRRWVHLNQLASILRLPAAVAVRDWVVEWIDKTYGARSQSTTAKPAELPTVAPALAERARVIGAIDMCLGSSGPRSTTALIATLVDG